MDNNKKEKNERYEKLDELGFHFTKERDECIKKCNKRFTKAVILDVITIPSQFYHSYLYPFLGLYPLFFKMILPKIIPIVIFRSLVF